jgi:hypothetical protein
MSTFSLCPVCGREDEDAIHAFLCCPHARNLWMAMEEVWELPHISRIKPVGQDWLKSLLLAASETQRAMMLMTFWRIWHAHNELTHGKEFPSIEGSRRFLVSYLNSLMLIKQFPEADVGKGKMVVDQR